jgi:uncharacterized damage-inducible protein DinB
MQPFFADYLNRLGLMHTELGAALEGLPQAALDWVPAEGANSLAAIAVHTAGAERYWIGDCIAGEPSGRDREAEFRAGGLPAETLVERLDASLSFVSRVLDGLSLEDLHDLRTLRDGSLKTVGWVLAHVLAHTAIHAGHAQATRQWWEKSFPG